MSWCLSPFYAVRMSESAPLVRLLGAAILLSRSCAVFYSPFFVPKPPVLIPPFLRHPDSRHVHAVPGGSSAGTQGPDPVHQGRIEGRGGGEDGGGKVEPNLRAVPTGGIRQRQVREGCVRRTLLLFATVSRSGRIVWVSFVPNKVALAQQRETSHA